MPALPNAWAETYEVSIPRGAANPTIDLTFQNVGKCYVPSELTVRQGDTVTWVNYPLQSCGLPAPLLHGSQELFPASATELLISAGVHSRGSMSEPNPFPALCSKWYRLMSVLRRSSTLPGSDISF
jgi:hypothetical protein